MSVASHVVVRKSMSFQMTFSLVVCVAVFGLKAVSMNGFAMITISFAASCISCLITVAKKLA